jgi:hypothetical protein
MNRPKMETRSVTATGMQSSVKSLEIAELHPAYHTASHSECVSMANLGAIVYEAMGTEMFVRWEKAMSAEEGVKIAKWREEGRKEGCQSMLESLKTKLAAADTLPVQIATLEGTIAYNQQELLKSEARYRELKKSIESEVEIRVSQMLEFRMAKEVGVLQQRLAAAEAKEEMLVLVKEGQAAMREKVQVQEEMIDTLKTQIAQMISSTTKSSHAIGKVGETTVYELLTCSVVPQFLYSRVEDMSGVSHAADFHLWVMSPIGKNVKILLDAKKYKDMVRTKEITKMHSDVDGDEEASGGILVSLDSSIATAKQFQLEKTPKGKYVMYIVLRDMTDEQRGDVLCWAVRVVSTLSSYIEEEDQTHLVENLMLFLKEMNKSVREADGVIRSAAKTVEMAKQMRDGLVIRLKDFRVGTLKETGDEVEEEEEKPVVDETRCGAIKNDGKPCQYRRLVGENACKLHKK